MDYFIDDNKNTVLSLQVLDIELGNDDIVQRGLTIITTVRTLTSTVSNNCSSISIACR